ncbi:glutamine synthetase III [Solirubrobacter phytolaccae]|uniref:Glutamine synthetase III n=1 Tax=Solirubrobacter phytolaccae TaxID=1404360 RepID=A0A9X3N4G8_9ACTN|nr:glutamine synthetase III [Solirubrobacter phytolaccae]MDA0179326.1 glutamine synthetase III [Solirubrobacter phytolaccae]
MSRPSESHAARIHRPRVGAAPAPYAFVGPAQREWLTPAGHALLQAAVADGRGLQPSLADEVARALRGWAGSRGATRVAFRVQTLAGGTADYTMDLKWLTGEDLVGGARTAAPGRLTWDPVAPAHIRVDAGGAVLCLPSVLASDLGEALDDRLPLLRSVDALSATTVRALQILGEEPTRRVLATVALTRTVVLFDAEPFALRTLEDRTRACLNATERELARIDVRARLRYNGDQHELTVLPASASVASDSLGLALEALRDTARRYGLGCREAGQTRPDVWSLITAEGTNLLAPGVTAYANLRFLFFAAAVIRAFASRDLRRLDLGHELTAILTAIARGELFAGSDAELVAGAEPLPRVPGRDTSAGFTGAGFALGRLDAVTMTVVNTLVADAITEQTRMLRSWLEVGEDLEPAVREVVADAFRRHQMTMGAHSLLDVLTGDDRLFAEQGVMSARELAARR